MNPALDSCRYSVYVDVVYMHSTVLQNKYTNVLLDQNGI